MTQPAFPACIELSLTRAHPSWHGHLRSGLQAMALAQPDYFSELARCEFLPTAHRMFAAFAVPLNSIHYVLMGEGPYPRAESATGVCFMDGAVHSLWQDGVGLSKEVNRATSLRNFVKMLLVADGVLNINHTGAVAMQSVSRMACAADSNWIRTGSELQSNLMGNGFLLLNASLVFRPEVAPASDARAWLPFLRIILQALSCQPEISQLILWGRIAEKIAVLPEVRRCKTLVSEHPYNLSFIGNEDMQHFFRPFQLLKKSRSSSQ